MSSRKYWQITGGDAPYTIRTEHFAVAVVATLMIGEGRLGVKALTSAEEMPTFEIPMSLHYWCKSTFGMTPKELDGRVVKGYLQDLKRALDSVELGLPGERNITRPRESQDVEARAKIEAKRLVQTLHAAIKRQQPRIH